MNRFFKIIKYFFTPLKISFILALVIHLGILILGDSLINFNYNQTEPRKKITFKLNQLSIALAVDNNDFEKMEQIKEKKGNKIVEKDVIKPENIKVNTEEQERVEKEPDNMEQVEEKTLIKEDITTKKSQKGEKSLKEKSDTEISLEDKNEDLYNESVPEDVEENKTQTNNKTNQENNLTEEIRGKEEIKDTNLLEEIKYRVPKQEESAIENNEDRKIINDNKSSSESIDQFQETKQVKESEGTIEIENKKEDKKKTVEKAEETKTDFQEKEGIRIDLTDGIPGKGVNPPEVMNYKSPLYPERLRKRGLEGKVILKILIDSSGVVIQIEIAESSGYTLFDTSALEAVDNWKFKPTTKDGINVESWILVPIVFKLK